jgi:hypothetical protein
VKNSKSSVEKKLSFAHKKILHAQEMGLGNTGLDLCRSLSSDSRSQLYIFTKMLFFKVTQPFLKNWKNKTRRLCLCVWLTNTKTCLRLWKKVILENLTQLLCKSVLEDKKLRQNEVKAEKVWFKLRKCNLSWESMTKCNKLICSIKKTC